MTIDANIIIGYLAGDGAVVKALSQWKKEGKPLYLSTVAECEILSFSGWTPREERKIIKFLEENFVPIPFDRFLSRIAGKIRQNAKVKLPDAAIAASSILTKTPVVTRDFKHFRRIKGIKIVSF